MRAAIVVVFLLIVQSYSFAEPPVKHALPPASVAFENAGQWDFGDIKEGQTAKHEFVIKNNSDKPLKITNVNSSCGCTASQAKKKELAPGESTTIEVAFNSSGYSGWAQQFIFVNTDDLQNQFLRYIIRGNVVTDKNKQKKK